MKSQRTAIFILILTSIFAFDFHRENAMRKTNNYTRNLNLRRRENDPL